MLVAMGLSLIPIATLFFFNDNLSLGDESEAIRRQSYDGATARAAELPIDPGEFGLPWVELLVKNLHRPLEIPKGGCCCLL